MIDAGCARLDSPKGRDIDRRKQTKLDCRRHEKSGHDRSEGRVFRHVLRIFVVIAIVAFVLEFAIRKIERVLVPWAGKEP